jgi:hypothetical protein
VRLPKDLAKAILDQAALQKRAEDGAVGLAKDLQTRLALPAPDPDEKTEGK